MLTLGSGTSLAVANSYRWVIGATLVLAGALGIGRFAYTPLLPDMALLFDWRFAQAGDVASANFVGYMLGAMLAARVTNNLRLWVAMSLMASVLTTLLGAYATTFEQWLVVRLLSGVASAFCLVLVTTQLIYVLAQANSERLGNVHFAGVGVGIVLCMGVVYLPGSVEDHWRRLGTATAVIMLLAWMMFSRGAWRAVQPQREVAMVRTAGSPTSSGLLWRIVFGYGLFGYAYVVAATFVVAMANQLPQQAGELAVNAKSVWLIVGLALVPSVYLWQWWANRLGIFAVLRIAYLIECVGLVLAGVSGSYTVLAVACVLLGGTFAAITALGISAARYAAPQRIAFGVSAMTTAFAFGQLLGPAISGRLADYFGDFFWASLSAGLLLVVAAALLPKQVLPDDALPYDAPPNSVRPNKGGQE